MKQLSCMCMLCACIHVQYAHICGKLPENLRSAPTLPSFKFRLKTFLFATDFYYIKFGKVHYYSLALRLNCTDFYPPVLFSFTLFLSYVILLFSNCVYMFPLYCLVCQFYLAFLSSVKHFQLSC